MPHGQILAREHCPIKSRCGACLYVNQEYKTTLPEKHQKGLALLSEAGVLPASVRQMAPWNGRHLALGFEPICSAFDLGPQISTADNPISRRGTKTARRFSAGERFTTRYRIAVEAAEIL